MKEYVINWETKKNKSYTRYFKTREQAQEQSKKIWKNRYNYKYIEYREQIDNSTKDTVKIELVTRKYLYMNYDY